MIDPRTSRDPESRVALVTGASRGIGRAIALGLARDGAAVALHGASHTETLDATLAEARQSQPRCVAVTGDLSDPDASRRIVEDAAAALGPPDILVVNASVQTRQPWAEISQETAAREVQVNLLSSLRLIQAAAPAMRARRWGRIVVVGSVQHHRPHPDMAVYAATKSALENLARNLARQLGPDGVTVNTLSPGVILTDRNSEALADPLYAERVRALIPLHAFGEPEDLVGAALLLCSEAGRYITGAEIRVDGGMSL